MQVERASSFVQVANCGSYLIGPQCTDDSDIIIMLNSIFKAVMFVILNHVGV